MDQESIKRILAQQEQRRQKVLNEFNCGTAATDLANLALDHSSDGAEAAARLLLSMEYFMPFDFRFLLKFDVENRAKADLLMMGYKPHNLWPSQWMDESGSNGKKIMSQIKSKWHFNPEAKQ